MSIFYKKEARVAIPEINNGYPIELSIETHDINGIPDCRIGHFGYNFWFRTKKAINEKKYKNNRTMEQAIRQSITKRGYRFLGWV